MAYTFTINGTVFGQVAGNVAGRYAVRMIINSQEYDLKRFHPPGTDGNLIVRCGRIGGEITAVMRYIGTKANALTSYTNDKVAWQNSSITIIGDDGNTYSRCNLLPRSMTRSEMQGIAGAGSLVFFDASATFTID